MAKKSVEDAMRRQHDSRYTILGVFHMDLKAEIIW